MAISVKDASGATVSVETGNPNGRAAAASSKPIALSTEDKTALDLLHTDLVAATPAGANIIGKVGIDQTTPGTTNAVVPGGNVASGVTDAGNPVKVGGVGSSTLPTAVTAGQRTNLWTGLNGQIIIGGISSAGADGLSNTMAFFTDGAGAAKLLPQSAFTFNGTTWDRNRKANVYSRVASSAASGNPASAKASAGDVLAISGLNGAAITYIHLYNKATAPTLGTDTPILSYAIPASANFSIMLPNGGAYFSTGIAYAFTTDIATIPTTGAAAAAITAFALLMA